MMSDCHSQQTLPPFAAVSSGSLKNHLEVRGRLLPGNLLHQIV